MKRRDISLVAVSLIAGLLVGIIISGAGGGSLFGTAGFSAAAPPAYYLVDTTESRNWLASAYPSQSSEIETAFNNIDALVTTNNFSETVRAIQPDINLIVANTYAALTGVTASDATSPTPDPLLTSLSDGNVSSCLGLDENPYNVDGYALYLYIQIPSTQTQFVPESWERLTGPKEDDLFWQRLACQSLEQAQSSQRR